MSIASRCAKFTKTVPIANGRAERPDQRESVLVLPSRQRSVGRPHFKIRLFSNVDETSLISRILSGMLFPYDTCPVIARALEMSPSEKHEGVREATIGPESVKMKIPLSLMLRAPRTFQSIHKYHFPAFSLAQCRGFYPALCFNLYHSSCVILGLFSGETLPAPRRR